MQIGLWMGLIDTKWFMANQDTYPSQSYKVQYQFPCVYNHYIRHYTFVSVIVELFGMFGLCLNCTVVTVLIFLVAVVLLLLHFLAGLFVLVR